MSNSKNDLNPTKESEKFTDSFINKGLGDENKGLGDENKSYEKEYKNAEKIKDRFHLNSLITKNISLFTKNPNYKMLTWLIVQLIIFSLFVLVVNIFKNNLIPYFNS
tara:strand:- start:954 stop:1274 length:321 start_codon:yes stop_codon:yes gene_type:complete